MDKIAIPARAQEILLNDAIQRDRATARRACLLQILWQERHLTREQLVTRVEAVLGKNCFGDSAWKDTFSRDMRVVRRALRAAGYQLVYRRNLKRPGYELLNQPPISPELARTLDGSVSEVEPNQIRVLRRLSAAERFQLGCSISDAARTAVAYRIRQRNPALSLAETHRLTLSQATES